MTLVDQCVNRVLLSLAAQDQESCASVLKAASRWLYGRGMSSFDYNAPAEPFLAKPMKGSRTKYWRFATAAEALRYAIEDLGTPKAFGSWLEVGDQRFTQRNPAPVQSRRLSVAQA